MPPSDPPVTGEVPESVMAEVRTRLAIDSGGANLAGANVVTSEAVDWNDGSLGCAERGMVYTQAITPGYHVVISVDGREYDYRVSESGEVRLCEAAGPRGG